MSENPILCPLNGVFIGCFDGDSPWFTNNNWENDGNSMDMKWILKLYKIIKWLLNPINFPFQETTGRHGRPWSTSTRPMPWTASGRTPWRGSPSARWSWERCNVPSKAPNGGGNGRISRKKGEWSIDTLYIYTIYKYIDHIYIFIYLYYKYIYIYMTWTTQHLGMQHSPSGSMFYLTMRSLEWWGV